MSTAVSSRLSGLVHAALIAACAVSLSPASIAATASKKTPLLTREELRACMARQTKLHQDRDGLVQVKSSLDAEKDAIVQNGAALKDQLAALDRTNAEQVAKYVEANNAREKRIDAYEQSSKDYNGKLESLEAANTAYKTDCENRRFDEKDEIAIKKGK
jgi:hypothetical protein